MLYELLTGRLPFEGQTPLAVMLQHLQGEVPPPRSINPALSPAWDEVLLRCLAKSPDDRYPTAQALDEAIQAAWRQVQRASAAGPYPTGYQGGHSSAPADTGQRGPGDPAEVEAYAVQALADGDWPRAMMLCGQLLALDPAHAEAATLLARAQDALRRQQTDGQAQQAAALVRDAETAFAAGALADARRLYQQALEASSGFMPAQAGLERVEQAQRLAELYAAARAALVAEQWGTAATRLDELAAAAPGYRDVGVLRAVAQRGLELDHSQRFEASLAAWYEHALSAVARQDWTGAAAAFHQIVSVRPDYRDAATQLFNVQTARELSLTLANAQAALAGGRPQEALDLLEPVVQRTPTSAEAQWLLAQARAALAAAPAAARPAPPRRPTATHARVYVANRNGGTVSAIAAADHRVVATVPVGAGPLGLAVSPDSKHLYVANRGSNRLQIVDLANHTVVGAVPLTSGPYSVAVHPDGERVYVARHFGGGLSVVDVGRQVLLATVPVGRNPTGVAIVPNGERVYVANSESHSVSVVDAGRQAVVATIGLPRLAYPEAVAVSPDGSRVYVANFRGDSLTVIDSMRNQALASIAVGRSPAGVAVAPDGERVYVANFEANSVSVVDPANLAVVDTFTTERWPRGLVVTPDGVALYVATRGNNCVQVFDTSSHALLATVPVGDSPQGIALAGA
jgi:YVTN family beta-propeller protein